VKQGTDPTKTGNYYTNRTKRNLLFHETKTSPTQEPKRWRIISHTRVIIILLELCIQKNTKNKNHSTQ